jgi:hypothetical protein
MPLPASFGSEFSLKTFHSERKLDQNIEVIYNLIIVFLADLLQLPLQLAYLATLLSTLLRRFV